jgi:hypothetical protein
MPRVNRDLQRRLAARRERERRRPTERRYQFASSEATVDPTLVEENGTAAEATEATTSSANRQSGAASSRSAGASGESVPFSAYKAEYAYVSKDLRRVAAVVGSLLVALLILYFILPTFIH